MECFGNLFFYFGEYSRSAVCGRIFAFFPYSMVAAESGRKYLPQKIFEGNQYSSLGGVEKPHAVESPL